MYKIYLANAISLAASFPCQLARFYSSFISKLKLPCPTKRCAVPPDAAPRRALKKMYCTVLFIIAGATLQATPRCAALRCAVPCREMKESRVAKKTPPCIISIALGGATLAEFCGAAARRLVGP